MDSIASTCPDGSRALIELLRTAPVPGLPEGLHYPSQLRAIGAAAGLDMEPEFSLDHVIAETRRRLGWGPAAGEESLAETAAGEDAPGSGGCPGPTLEDVRPAARLRDRLAAALRAETDAECAQRLTELSTEWELRPGLDAQCRPATVSTREGFLAQLAAVLVISAMDIAASGHRSGLRRCSAPSCGLPFLDGSRDGRGRYCSPTCSSRAKARRRRDRLFSPDQPIG